MRRQLFIISALPWWLQVVESLPVWPVALLAYCFPHSVRPRCSPVNKREAIPLDGDQTSVLFALAGVDDTCSRRGQSERGQRTLQVGLESQVALTHISPAYERCARR